MRWSDRQNSALLNNRQEYEPGEVISAIINGTEELILELKDFGVEIHSTGGETANFGD
jgi:phosphoribosylformylglycinamidine cyclo-ligase